MASFSTQVDNVHMNLAGIQTLRGVAANLVVLFHCFEIGLLPKYGFKHEFDSLNFFSNFWSGVDLFFCISGFVMCYSYLGSNVSGRDYFLARIFRIVPLYWIVTTTNFAIISVFGLEPDFGWFFQSLFFSVNLDNRLPILAAGWTLQYEMFFYLVFAAVLVLFKRNRLAILILMLLVTIIMQNKHLIVLEFIFGCIAYFLYKLKFTRRFKVQIFCLFIAIYIVSLIAIDSSFASDYRVLLFGIPSLFVVAAVANMRMPKHSFQIVGSYSFSLYLVHFQMLSLIFKFYDKFMPESTSAAVLIFIGIVACNLAGFVTWKYMEAPITNYFRSKFLHKST